MSEHATAQQSVTDSLRAIGKGARPAALDAGARYNLERLESATARFWGAPGEARLEAKCRRLQAVFPAFEAKRRQLQVADSLIEPLWQIYLPLAQWIVERSGSDSEKAWVLGVNGAQGSGKTTLCALLQSILEAGFGQRVATLSLDDFYLSQAGRRRLVRAIHPLLGTRGVPGTHDVALGMKTLESLLAADRHTNTPLPVFDKARGNPIPSEQWPVFQGRPSIVLLEGWCVGAKPQPEEALDKPINRLEASEDPHGVWRRYVNRRLREDYSQWFSFLDALLFLKIPDFGVVYTQRLEQERKLQYKLQELEKAGLGGQAMDTRALRRFIMHFQRLTEHMLDEMPGRTDLTLEIDEKRQFRKAISTAERRITSCRKRPCGPYSGLRKVR